MKFNKDDFLDSIWSMQFDATRHPVHNVIRENETSYVLQIATPGFSQSELKIKIENQTLTITGEPCYEDNRVYMHQGFSHAKFSKSFKLNEQLKVKEAKYRNGVLFIQLEKVAPKTNSVEISIS